MPGARVIPVPRNAINSASGLSQPKNQPSAAQNETPGLASGQNPIPSVYIKQISTPQGNVGVRFQGNNPVAITKNQVFSEPISQTSNGYVITGSEQYTYSLGKGGLVATPIGSSGSVVYNGVQVASFSGPSAQFSAIPGATVTEPIYGNVQGASSNQYLGTVSLVPTNANGQLTLSYSGFASTGFYVTEPESVNVGGKIYNIGVGSYATTSYNPSTGNVTVNSTSFSQQFPGLSSNLFLNPQIQPASTGFPAIAYNVSVNFGAGTATQNYLGIASGGRILQTSLVGTPGNFTFYSFTPSTQTLSATSINAMTSTEGFFFSTAASLFLPSGGSSSTYAITPQQGIAAGNLAAQKGTSIYNINQAVNSYALVSIFSLGALANTKAYQTYEAIPAVKEVGERTNTYENVVLGGIASISTGIGNTKVGSNPYFSAGLTVGTAMAESVFSTPAFISGLASEPLALLGGIGITAATTFHIAVTHPEELITASNIEKTVGYGLSIFVFSAGSKAFGKVNEIDKVYNNGPINVNPSDYLKFSTQSSAPIILETEPNLLSAIKPGEVQGYENIFIGRTTEVATVATNKEPISIVKYTREPVISPIKFLYTTENPSGLVGKYLASPSTSLVEIDAAGMVTGTRITETPITKGPYGTSYYFTISEATTNRVDVSSALNAGFSTEGTTTSTTTLFYKTPFESEFRRGTSITQVSSIRPSIISIDKGTGNIRISSQLINAPTGVIPGFPARGEISFLEAPSTAVLLQSPSATPTESDLLIGNVRPGKPTGAAIKQGLFSYVGSGPIAVTLNGKILSFNLEAPATSLTTLEKGSEGIQKGYTTNAGPTRAPTRTIYIEGKPKPPAPPGLNIKIPSIINHGTSSSPEFELSAITGTKATSAGDNLLKGIIGIETEAPKVPGEAVASTSQPSGGGELTRTITITRTSDVIRPVFGEYQEVIFNKEKATGSVNVQASAPPINTFKPGIAYKPTTAFKIAVKPGIAYKPITGFKSAFKPSEAFKNAYKPSIAYKPAFEPGVAYKPSVIYKQPQTFKTQFKTVTVQKTVPKTPNPNIPHEAPGTEPTPGGPPGLLTLSLFTPAKAGSEKQKTKELPRFSYVADLTHATLGYHGTSISRRLGRAGLGLSRPLL